jgi:hypothetical protein
VVLVLGCLATSRKRNQSTIDGTKVAVHTEMKSLISFNFIVLDNGCPKWHSGNLDPQACPPYLWFPAAFCLANSSSNVLSLSRTNCR